MKDNTQPLLRQLFRVYQYIAQVKKVSFGEIGVLLENVGDTIDYATLLNGLDVLVSTKILEKDTESYSVINQGDSFEHFCNKVIGGMRLNDSKLIAETFNVEGIRDINKDGSVYFWRAFVNPKNRYLLPYLDDLGLISFTNEGRVIFMPSSSIIAQSIVEGIHKSSKRRKSLDTLLAELEAKRKLGARAETLAMTYETKRLIQLGHTGKAELISNDYVNAGYDIQSYSEKDTHTYDRFIEVKALSPGRGFYLSRNELEIANELKDSYYMYLVDIAKSTAINPVIHILCDPASVLFSGTSDWRMTVESYHFEPLAENGA